MSLREQLNFKWDYNKFRRVLDQNDELDFYSASSLTQQSAGTHAAPPGHIILIPIQPVLLVDVSCLAEKQTYQFNSL